MINEFRMYHFSLNLSVQLKDMYIETWQSDMLKKKLNE